MRWVSSELKGVCGGAGLQHRSTLGTLLLLLHVFLETALLVFHPCQVLCHLIQSYVRFEGRATRTKFHPSTKNLQLEKITPLLSLHPHEIIEIGNSDLANFRVHALPVLFVPLLCQL